MLNSGEYVGHAPRLPVSISNNTQPNAQTSRGCPQGAPWRVSGLISATVPRMTPIWVIAGEAIERRNARALDLAHPTGPEDADDFVRADAYHVTVSPLRVRDYIRTVSVAGSNGRADSTGNPEVYCRLFGMIASFSPAG